MIGCWRWALRTRLVPSTPSIATDNARFIQRSGLREEDLSPGPEDLVPRARTQGTKTLPKATTHASLTSLLIGIYPNPFWRRCPAGSSAQAGGGVHDEAVIAGEMCAEQAPPRLDGQTRGVGLGVGAQLIARAAKRRVARKARRRSGR